MLPRACHVALASAALLFLFAAVACSARPGTLAPSAPPPTAFGVITPGGSFILASDAIAEGGTIPKKLTCDGENRSPELAWDNPPERTQSFVLIVDDPDAPNGTFTHWVAFDIPSTQREIREGAQTVAKGGLNGAGKTGYTGPCPPSGTHRYFFSLYALDASSLGLADGASRTEVEKAMSGHLLAKAQLMGRYSR